MVRTKRGEGIQGKVRKAKKSARFKGFFKAVKGATGLAKKNRKAAAAKKRGGTSTTRIGDSKRSAGTNSQRGTGNLSKGIVGRANTKVKAAKAKKARAAGGNTTTRSTGRRTTNPNAASQALGKGRGSSGLSVGGTRRPAQPVTPRGGASGRKGLGLGLGGASGGTPARKFKGLR
jgi:hypothetical protein